MFHYNVFYITLIEFFHRHMQNIHNKIVVLLLHANKISYNAPVTYGNSDKNV